jgi:hypothetical protein
VRLIAAFTCKTEKETESSMDIGGPNGIGSCCANDNLGPTITALVSNEMQLC